MNDEFQTSVNSLSNVVFLSKILEQLFLILNDIEQYDSYTVQQAGDEILKAARLIKERIGETEF